jgi:hypothetical protein
MKNLKKLTIKKSPIYHQVPVEGLHTELEEGERSGVEPTKAEHQLPGVGHAQEQRAHWDDVCESVGQEHYLIY